MIALRPERNWNDATYPNPLTEVQRSIKPPIRVIGFTDSANAYASVANLHPRSVGELTKLTLSFLRDLASGIAYSFIDTHLIWQLRGRSTMGTYRFIFARVRKGISLQFLRPGRY